MLLAAARQPILDAGSRFFIRGIFFIVIFLCMYSGSLFQRFASADGSQIVSFTHFWNWKS